MLIRPPRCGYNQSLLNPKNKNNRYTLENHLVYAEIPF
jgi:hypothetical protein